MVEHLVRLTPQRAVQLVPVRAKPRRQVGGAELAEHTGGIALVHDRDRSEGADGAAAGGSGDSPEVLHREARHTWT